MAAELAVVRPTNSRIRRPQYEESMTLREAGAAPRPDLSGRVPQSLLARMSPCHRQHPLGASLANDEKRRRCLCRVRSPSGSVAAGLCSCPAKREGTGGFKSASNHQGPRDDGRPTL